MNNFFISIGIPLMISPLHHGGDIANGEGILFEITIAPKDLVIIASRMKDEGASNLSLEIPAPTWERYLANPNKFMERTSGAGLFIIRVGRP